MYALMRRITIKDIAIKLGITPSTVSRALAGNPRISERTRKKVVAAAKSMGYEHNVIASSLRKGKSDTVGMIVPGINRSFFSNVISGVEEILNAAGYNLVIIQSNESLLKEQQAVQTLLNNRVGGVIISLSVQSKDYSHVRKVADRGIPLVQFDRVASDISGPKIVNDNFTGAYLSVKHLLKNGYTRIAHFSGSPDINVYKERMEGYKAALEEAGLDFDTALVFDNSITRETGRRNVDIALNKLNADAVFSSGDFSALGALERLKELGVKVPQEFGVTGFANEPFAGLMHPSLTSVEQNTREMGNRIAQSIIKAMRGEKAEEFVDISVRLIVRQSSLRDGNQ
jgi:LacI family transcriptional regulator